MRTTLQVERIQKAVQAEVPDLKVWIDDEGDPGNFLCNYLAFLGIQYQVAHSHCKAAGFIHVGPDVDVQTATKANEAVLRVVIQE